MEDQDDILEFDVSASSNGKRTGLLTTACVLSWIMGGIMVLSTGLMLLMKNFFLKLS